MDAVLSGGLFGLGGVVLGAILNDRSSRHGRREARDEQREDQRLARELVAAERLDDALFSASRAVECAPEAELGEAIHDAHEAWADAWVAFSPRVRSYSLIDRYTAVGNVLLLYTGIAKPTGQDREVVVRAIRSARWALAYFLRGDDAEPDRSFPGEDETRRLIGEGRDTNDPAGPLRAWVSENDVPMFRPDRD